MLVPKSAPCCSDGEPVVWLVGRASTTAREQSAGRVEVSVCREQSQVQCEEATEVERVDEL
ncbi:hypothetical protein N566_12285 [Streptomycetaceae bacterium MP113-05]|nr:hypothetical protein N566_12285 [Streptomycetaceae bacterium MP113-05]